MVDQFQLDPMQVIEALQRRVQTLMMENVQLEAAVSQLQVQVATLMEVPGNNGEVQLEPEAEEWVKEVTDEVVGAEITS